ncbi:MFS transporter [Amycolatopsis sp. GM8]|uniref:MFS transporter n=1 Tax=Amycolatopsis sp. GM8 TaxID=2896530 RepID=UPI001F38C98E|nr:MFS transporter [Amycolatopsis sp. GM8]
MNINTPPAAGVATASLTARLDRLPRLTRAHAGWVVLLGALFLCDLADLNAMAYAAPAIRAEWGVSVATIGELTSYSFLGMFVGGFLGGRLSDRFGRKKILVAATVLYAAASLLCAVAGSVPVLAVFRILTGIGLQAVTGVLIVYVAEMFPRHSRGRYQAIMLAIGLLGVPLIAGAARIIVPLGPSTWRWLFVVGAIGLVPGLLALFVLPESVRWQELNGQAGRAEALVARLENEVRSRTGSPLPDPVERGAEPAHRPGELLRRPGNRRRVVVASVTMVFAILGFYGFNAWVPTLLVERGLSTASALTITTILSIAPFAGAAGALLITDRWERRRIALVLCVLVAVAMVVFALSHDYWLLVGAGFVVTLLLQTNTAIVYAYLPEVFPTNLRGLGSGIANGTGRLAGFAGGFIIAAIFAGLGFVGVFVATAIFMLASGLVLGLFGERTTGKTLEEIN